MLDGPFEDKDEWKKCYNADGTFYYVPKTKLDYDLAAYDYEEKKPTPLVIKTTKAALLAQVARLTEENARLELAAKTDRAAKVDMEDRCNRANIIKIAAQLEAEHAKRDAANAVATNTRHCIRLGDDWARLALSPMNSEEFKERFKHLAIATDGIKAGLCTLTTPKLRNSLSKTTKIC